MKRVLKWVLIGLAAAGCLAAVQMARQAADLPALSAGGRHDSNRESLPTPFW